MSGGGLEAVPQDVGERVAAPSCEHYWAWVSPAGTRNWARICQLCHEPDPAWLNHVVEVDMSDTCDASPCVHCEFGEVLDPRVSVADGPERGYRAHGR